MSWLGSFLRLVIPPCDDLPPDLAARVAQLEDDFRAQRQTADAVSRQVGNITRHLGLDEAIDEVTENMQ